MEDLLSFAPTAALLLALLYGAYWFLTRSSNPSVKPLAGKAKGTAAAGAAGSDKKFPVRVVYASQSGTSEGFARALKKEAVHYNVNMMVEDISEFQPDELRTESAPIFFLVATYGEGDPTDSGVEFQTWLMNKEREFEPLSQLKFGVFALGNRQYDKFAAFGKRVDARLEALQGQRLVPLGTGDDDGTMEEDWAAWRAQMWQILCDKYGLSKTVGADTYSTTYRVRLSPELSQASEEGDVDATLTAKRILAFDSKYKVVEVPLVESREMRTTTDSLTDGSTLHLEFDLTNVRMPPYVTADNLGLHPRNPFKLVARCAKRLGVHPSAILTLDRASREDRRKAPCPSPCVVRDALAWHVDLGSPPKVALLDMFAALASDEKEAAELKKLSTPSNKAEYQKQIVQPHMSLVDVLEKYASVKLSLDQLLEYAPKLLPRYYTIASSSKVQPQRVAIAVSVIRSKLPSGQEFVGCATGFMATMRPGKDFAYIHIKPSEFRLPKQVNTPMLMVGPGTGFAPFRGFLQERRYMVENQQGPLGAAHLFFGCRRRECDWIYRSEMEGAKKDGLIDSLEVALSREKDTPKVYVQQRIAARAADIRDLLFNQGAYFYVCGATSMGREVREAVIAALAHPTACKDAAAALAYVDAMQSQKRYVQELWES